MGDEFETFERHRGLLFAIAYRMLGSAMDAEDAVQETYLRWQRAHEDDIQSPKAYFSAVVTRLCIDQLRSAQARREAYIGPWLPEPLMSTGDTPAEHAQLADSLSIAFLVLLESLSPLERAVFLLREVFDYEYAEIAAIVEKSEANCRQMVSRARTHLAERRPRFDATPEQRQRMTAQFAQVCVAGDMDGLLALLADDITLVTDSGGKVRAARRPISGPDKVARFLFGVLQHVPPGFTARFAQVNGQPAIVGTVDGRPYSVLTLEVAGGRIHAIYNLMNPEKLGRMV